MIDLLEISNAATKILVAIENIFNAHITELPARRYITVGGMGTVAYDCTQLTVSWQETSNGLPNNPQFGVTNRNCTTMHSGVFVVELVREIPVSLNAEIPPEPNLIQEAAKKLMKDAVLLHEAGEIAAEDSLLDGGTITISAGDPAGGLQSIIMTVAMVI